MNNFLNLLSETDNVIMNIVIFYIFLLCGFLFYAYLLYKESKENFVGNDCTEYRLKNKNKKENNKENNKENKKI